MTISFANRPASGAAAALPAMRRPFRPFPRAIAAPLPRRPVRRRSAGHLRPLQIEYYDGLDVSDAEKRAGAEEGVCHHDTDTKNSGTGAGSLNGTESYEKEFRMFVKPDANALDVGWIAPGEWVRYVAEIASGFTRDQVSP